MTGWDERFLSLAKEVSSWSKDPSTQVGSVIVRPDKTIASLGFNGFPRGLSDDDELYADRETKYARTIHAEVNALLNTRDWVKGYTIYVTAPPCSNCALTIIQSEIKRVVFPKPTADLLERWGDSIDKATKLFKEAGIEVTEL